MMMIRMRIRMRMMMMMMMMMMMWGNWLLITNVIGSNIRMSES